jgi:hypothetical protein
MPDGRSWLVQPELRQSTAKTRETPADTAHASPNAPPPWRIWARNLGISAIAGIFLALIGALDSGRLPLLTRLAYWVPLMIGGAAIAGVIAVLIDRSPWRRLNVWVFGAVLALVVSFPITLGVWGYTHLLFGRGTDSPLAQFPAVVVISAAMTAIMLLVNQPGAVTHAPAAGAAATPVRFLERLPAKLKGAAIYAVSAEDHYLRLHTSKGGDLILMRLSDAIAELEGLEGAQTHRSWWVARDAVEEARRDGERVTLVLKGGAEAPVSRPNIRPLREAGWL